MTAPEIRARIFAHPALAEWSVEKLQETIADQQIEIARLNRELARVAFHYGRAKAILEFDAERTFALVKARPDVREALDAPETVLIPVRLEDSTPAPGRLSNIITLAEAIEGQHLYSVLAWCIAIGNGEPVSFVEGS